LVFNDLGNLAEIEGLNNLKSLKYLTVSSNSLKRIENLDALINLEGLVVIDSECLDKIENLENLTNLRHLDVSQNNITEIKGLE